MVTIWRSNVKSREFSIWYQPYYLFSENILARTLFVWKINKKFFARMSRRKNTASGK